jgi:hypothetical protein
VPETGAAGSWLPQLPSDPVVTHVVSVAERTRPGFVACRLFAPEALNVSGAVPSAPVVALPSPKLTVAPAAGCEVVVVE